MGEKKKLKSDITLKTYWHKNEEFADLFNAFLYKGENVIKAEHLQEKDTDSSVILRMENDVESKAGARDIFKVVMSSEGIEYVLLGIENQEGIHYAMPLRNLEYNTFAYIKQYEKIKEKYPDRKGLSGYEFLSHMKKTDKLTPVVTLVIYYGDEEWDAGKSLYDMMDVSEELRPFVSDYKMNLIEVRNSELVFHNKNNKDLFHLFRLLYNKKKNAYERKEEVLEYIDDNKVDDNVIMAVSSTSRVKIESKKEETAMGNLFDEFYDMGIEQGIEQGIERGIEQGIEQGIERGVETIVSMGQDFGLGREEIVVKIKEMAGVDEEKAQEYYDRYDKECV